MYTSDLLIGSSHRKLKPFFADCQQSSFDEAFDLQIGNGARYYSKANLAHNDSTAAQIKAIFDGIIGIADDGTAKN